jgi:enoyl-CoA hydratase/carnithine racemase
MAPTLKDDIETDRQGATCIIRFARPAKKNALTLAMYERLNVALAEAVADTSVRSIVFGTTSDTFTAGNDLGDFMQSPPTGEDAAVFRFIHALAQCPKPMIAAVDGKAIGLGFTMLLHCDFVYVSDRAVLTAPFVNLGLVPEAASSLLLPLRIGQQRAAEVLLLGSSVSAAQALEWGLCNAVLPAAEVLPKACDTAAALAFRAPSAVRLSKQLMKDNGPVLAKMREEGALFIKQLQSPELAEAIGAFFEKRPPDFSRF